MTGHQVAVDGQIIGRCKGDQHQRLFDICKVQRFFHQFHSGFLIIQFTGQNFPFDFLHGFCVEDIEGLALFLFQSGSQICIGKNQRFIINLFFSFELIQLFEFLIQVVQRFHRLFEAFFCNALQLIHDHIRCGLEGQNGHVAGGSQRNGYIVLPFHIAHVGPGRRHGCLAFVAIGEHQGFVSLQFHTAENSQRCDPCKSVTHVSSNALYHDNRHHLSYAADGKDHFIVSSHGTRFAIDHQIDM